MNTVSSVRDLPRMENVSGHHNPAPFILTSDMFGGLPISMAGAEITELVGKPVADLHTHEMPEIYILVSPNPGGAVIDIELADETLTVCSPSAVYVPANTQHRFVTKVAETGSFCFGIFLPEGGEHR